MSNNNVTRRGNRPGFMVSTPFGFRANYASVESTGSDGSYQPDLEPSSQHIETPDLSQSSEVAAASKKEQAFYKLVEDPDVIQTQLLDRLPYEQQGWCQLVTRATNKSADQTLPLEEKSGYIQLSWDGVNHVSCKACLVYLEK